MRVPDDGSTNMASEVMGEATRESVARDLEHDGAGATEDASVHVSDAVEGDLVPTLPGPVYEINESATTSDGAGDATQVNASSDDASGAASSNADVH